ncbi:MAG: S9 family peptidase, partial [Gemmatimonadales bacterium]
MRTPLTLALLLAAPPAAAAQAPRAVTADDYARAERFLAPHTSRLVSGIAGPPTWLPDGRAWYRVSTAGGSRFVMVNPARRTRAPAFDHARLARALSAATGRPVEGTDLPFQSFELSR